jgi:hypothetical protein
MIKMTFATTVYTTLHKRIIAFCLTLHSAYAKLRRTLSERKTPMSKPNKTVVNRDNKISKTDKAFGYLAVLLLALGSLRMVQLEADNQKVIIGLGAFFVLFAINAVVKLLK